MYVTTRGIVFKQVKYSETSLVVKIYTEELGLRSYMIKGARSNRSKLKPSLFQPLTLLDLVVSEHDKGELHHIREAARAYAFQTIPADIRKTSILVFLNELLYKSIQEEETNRDLFRFIFDKIVMLDELPGNPAHFHLHFAIQLSRYLGFYPQGKYHGPTTVFDLEDGHFTDAPMLLHENVVRGQACTYLWQLMGVTWQDVERLTGNSRVRYELLEQLIRYYRLHLPMMQDFKSHHILHEALKKDEDN